MCLPNFQADLANRVFVDVMNEPDSMGIRWESSGDRPGAQQLYLSTADAVWRISPNQVMFMFEGASRAGGRGRLAARGAVAGQGGVPALQVMAQPRLHAAANP